MTEYKALINNFNRLINKSRSHCMTKEENNHIRQIQQLLNGGINAVEWVY